MISAVSQKSHCPRWLFFVPLFLGLFLGGCSAGDNGGTLSGSTMGTSWHISYWGSSGQPDETEIYAAVGEILESVEDSMSTYRPDSEISHFNDAPVDTWQGVSEGFFEVLHTALRVGELSEGAYDITVMPLVVLWGFGPGGHTDTVPDDGQIQELLSGTGQGKLKLKAPTVLKTSAVALDFSSLAKGYAVDRVAQWLEQKQIPNFLVEVGGEMRLSGLSQRQDKWRIAIEAPVDTANTVAQAMSVSDIAIATSGDYRNYFEHEGIRYSHSIDPRTGYPVKHDLVSVTVLHQSAMLADAWATALTVLGPEKAMDVAKKHELAVYFIQRVGDDFSSSYTSEFARLVPAVQTQQ